MGAMPQSGRLADSMSMYRNSNLMNFALGSSAGIVEPGSAENSEEIDVLMDDSQYHTSDNFLRITTGQSRTGKSIFFQNFLWISSPVLRKESPFRAICHVCPFPTLLSCLVQ
jgi:hypothetical protein